MHILSIISLAHFLCNCIHQFSMAKNISINGNKFFFFFNYNIRTHSNCYIILYYKNVYLVLYEQISFCGKLELHSTISSKETADIAYMSSSWQHTKIFFYSFWFHHSSLKLVVPHAAYVVLHEAKSSWWFTLAGNWDNLATKCPTL